MTPSRTSKDAQGAIGYHATSFFEHRTGAFFRKVDWLAFATAFTVTFLVYCATLAPTVTLEDSGELVVASDYLGVPHPPGYPIWTLLSWFFQWMFHWVKYYGYPNPAWSVGLMSAFFGALACGLLALLVSRSGTDMLRGVAQITRKMGYAEETLFCWIGGVSAGLLLAFSPVLWSQSVIAEVYSLNAFFLMLILVVIYRWMCRPHEHKLLYAGAFVFGVGLTNHQTLLFAALALLAAVWFRHRELFRDLLALAFVAIAALLFWRASGIKPGGPNAAQLTRFKIITETLGIIFLLAPGGLFLIERKILTEWRHALLIIACVALGLSFYYYMPVASEQNPPMNWGYPRTLEGFKHAITRGQYEKIKPAEIFSITFLRQLGSYFRDLRRQFTVPIALLALVPFLFFPRLERKARDWLITSLWAFFSLSIVLVIFLNPKLDIQTLFIQRVQLIQSHAVYAVWIGYGIMFALTLLETVILGRNLTRYAAVPVAALLPLVLIWQNAFDQEQLRIVGGAEQNGHDFGWQFGAWQLEGVNRILKELPPEELKSYPNPEYPPPMETNAIFFGGTDPGRFVPTYMIFCAHMREDVFLITQNALADNTYMSVMRDLYGDQIWIPAQHDSNRAFQQYVEDVRAGRIPAGASVTFESGRVSVQGVQGVMMINGILCRMIFDANKHRHAFYVEESYVIPWMYPYLTPHGLIMKLNPEPLPALPEDIVRNDRNFWDWYSHRLLNNRRFLRDVVARKTFSKLRSAIAGIYAFRHMFEHAEYAFKQAVSLYPLSPEANFRLADVYMQQRKFGLARQLVEDFLEQDPGNNKVRDFLDQIKQTEARDRRRQELETAFREKRATLNDAFELAEIYQELNLMPHFQQLTARILQDKNIPPEAYLRLAQIYARRKDYGMIAEALQAYLERAPSNSKIWVDLAAARFAAGQREPALEALRKAVEVGGEPARDAIRRDQRFDPVRNDPEFQRIVPAVRTSLPLPFSGL